MKKIFALLAVSLLFSSLSQKVFAQEAWQAGYVRLVFAGYEPDADNNPCNNNTLYHVELHMYREYIPGVDPYPATKDVTVRNQSLGVPFSTISVSLYEDDRVSKPCVNNNPVETEYGLYRTTSPVNLARSEDWEFFYEGAFRSYESNNILQGQTFSVKTKLNNVPCGTVVNPKDPTDIRVNNPTPTTTPSFIRPHPVLSFCSGINKTYHFEIPAEDSDNDNLSFVLTDATNENYQKVNYEPFYNGRNPFPSSSNIRMSNTGVLSFTPSTPFTSTVSVKMSETRMWHQIIMLQGQPRILSVPVNVSSTQIDYLFIFDDDCNKRLPQFEGLKQEYNPQTGQQDWVSTYNSTEDAYEFECGIKEMTFQLSNPIFCNTLDKNDFRIGVGYNGITEVVTAIDAVTYTSCSPEGELDQIKIKLYDQIGPGEYNIFFRYGSNDSTTILNRCDFDIPVDVPWVRIYINDNYTYKHPYTDTIYCNPADIGNNKGIRVPSDFVEGKSFGYGKAFFTWRQNPINPNSKIDTLFPGDDDFKKRGIERGSIFDVWVEDDNNPNTKVTNVIWQVGAGLDFSIYDPFTGDVVLERICYDTDNFLLTRYDNPPVEVPDYDLCPEDDWPTVDLQKHVIDDNALVEDFSWEAFNEFPLDRNKADITKKEKWSIIAVGQSSLKVPGVMLNRYNFFISNVPFLINGKTCTESDTFVVVKEDVKAIIGNDSTICPGEQYFLRNDYDYLVPDIMTYEWYFNDELVVDSTADSMMIDERGEYKLVVYKNTLAGTYCIGTDSVFINVADDLYAPEAACNEVTFENGIVQQTFGWSVVEGADGYQARSITMYGDTSAWEEANGDYSIYHDVNGAQMKLQSRPYNNEVPEDADCYYGPASNVAEACEVIIKPTNVFTPNGDGVNDFLAFDLLELYPGSKLQVFNRWGKLIYEDDSYYNDWDGEDYPAGTYFYVLDINDESYGIFKGSFTIIRD